MDPFQQKAKKIQLKKHEMLTYLPTLCKDTLGWQREMIKKEWDKKHERAVNVYYCLTLTCLRYMLKNNNNKKETK